MPPFNFEKSYQVFITSGYTVDIDDLNSEKFFNTQISMAPIRIFLPTLGT